MEHQQMQDQTEAQVRVDTPEAGSNPWLLKETEPKRKRGANKPRFSVKPFPSVDKKTEKAGPAKPKRRKGTRTGADHAGPVGFKAAPKRSQDVLGYQAMLPSGVAWLGGDEWSMTLRFSDINYVAAAEPRQESILDKWARHLNSFGAGSRVQISVINRVLDEADVASLVHKPLEGDAWDEYRADSNHIIKEKLSANSANTVTDKYLTITVQEVDREKAEATLTRMFHETEAHLEALEGCSCERLDRTERLALFSSLLRPYELFTFTEEGFAATKKSSSTGDYVAPWSVTTTGKTGPVVLRNGTANTVVSTLWVRDYPSWLTDRLFSELAEVKGDVNVTLHLEPYDQADGTLLVNRQIAELEMQSISEEKKAEKQGRSKETIPHKLRIALEEARGLRDELNDSNQRLFSTLLLVGVSGPDEVSVENNIRRVGTVLRKLSIPAETTTYMQRDSLTSILPSGRRLVPMRRTLTTSTAAVLIPFTTQELLVPGGLWYGMNAQSSNPLVADRTATKNGNGFILGTSGSGKGVAAKSEMSQVILTRPNDDVIIIDPEREYEPLVKAFAGETVRVHAGSEDHVNWMDLDLDNIETGTDPVIAKCAFVLSCIEALVGGVNGLEMGERAAVDRAALGLYRRYAAERNLHKESPDESSMPAMPVPEDLRTELISSGGEPGKRVADALELYTSGSLAGFSQQTNVDPKNRIVSWDISQLGNEMRGFAMMVILDQIWSRIVANKAAGKRTWLYVDEFHMLFNHPKTAEYFRELFKRARKWGAIPTGITQNIEELLDNADARLMLANCDFLMLLGQNETDADTIVELLKLSHDQRRYFMNVQPGKGLLRSGPAVVPFDARIPETSKLYKLFDTSFEDLKD